MRRILFIAPLRKFLESISDEIGKYFMDLGERKADCDIYAKYRVKRLASREFWLVLRELLELYRG